MFLKRLGDYIIKNTLFAGLQIKRMREHTVHFYRAGLSRSDKKVDPLWAKSSYFFGCLLLLLTIVTTCIYYLHRPYVEVTADTPGYLDFVNQLRETGNPINVFRLPMYPLFILLISIFAGSTNLFSVSIVQGILFNVATLEFYLLIVLIFRRGWMAFLIGLTMASNVIFISYCKVIMTEGLALWLLMTCLLLAANIIRTGNLRLLKWLTVVLALLFFTRPEWASFPVLLFVYILWCRYKLGHFRSILKRVFFSTLILYLLLGLYICCNFFINHYLGLTYVENMNLIGKVMQYHMQNEAPPEYAHVHSLIDFNVTHLHLTPYQLVQKYPELGLNHAKPMGDFARAILWRHPLEFGLKSVPEFFESLTSYYPVGTMPPPLNGLQHGWTEQAVRLLLSIDRVLYASNALFPYCALIWLSLLFWPHMRKLVHVQMMGLIVCSVLFALILTTLGGYFLSDDMRVHIVFDPLISLCVWGTILFVPFFFRDLFFAAGVRGKPISENEMVI